jgi:hypothetical protein
MQRAATAAADAVTKLDQRMQQIGETMKAHPNAPAPVTTAVDALTKQVTTLQTSIAGQGGQGGGGGGGGGGAQPVRNRINSLKQEVIGSQSLPTRVQMTQVDALQKQLAALVGQVNSVITSTLPSLHKQLHENSIFPSVGEPIKMLPVSTGTP